MAIFIMSDTHYGAGIGDEDKLLNLAADPDDIAIVCGDAGFVWCGDDYQLTGSPNKGRDGLVLDRLNSLGFTVCFVAGNHENYDALEEYPIVNFKGGRTHKLRENVYHLMNGELFEIEGKKCLTLGGAASADRTFRVEGVDWWPQEVPTIEELNEIGDRLKDIKEVDYIFSHQIPLTVKRILYPYYSVNTPDKYLLSFFDNILETIDFKYWYCGHYHNDKKYDKVKILYTEVVKIC